jgi:uncharacterized protein YegP (UPF0339 family)
VLIQGNEESRAGKFEIRKSINAKRSLFNLKAATRQVGLASELYDAKKRAEKRKTAKSGEPYFVLKAMNGEVIGTSEMYPSAKSVEKGIASIKKNAPDARIADPALE